MPAVFFTEAELAAIQDVWTREERVDWNAYERAKLAIVRTRRADDSAESIERRIHTIACAGCRVDT